MQFGILYIVATPIGNLKDITFRALDVLKSSNLVLAEDTRVTSKLLKHYDIDNHILSYHAHSNENRKNEILKMLVEGKTIALVTDAGTPGVSDPGNELIDFLLEREPLIPIVPIPGASALTSALSASGFRTNKFLFLGFLPKKGLRNKFEEYKNLGVTLCFFESPKRLKKTLMLLQEVFDVDTRILIARELTKLHEEVVRGTLGTIVEKLDATDPRGEVVVVIEGK